MSVSASPKVKSLLVRCRLSKQFRSLQEGRYPLAAELSEDEEEEVPRLDLRKARKRKAGEALEMMEAARQERKRYKAAMTTKRKREREGVAARGPKEDSDSGVDEESASEEVEDGAGDERVLPQVEEAPITKVKQNSKKKGVAEKKMESAVKEATGRKGKALFMPLRLAITGQPRGPEMADVMPLLAKKPTI